MHYLLSVIHELQPYFFRFVFAAVQQVTTLLSLYMTLSFNSNDSSREHVGFGFRVNVQAKMHMKALSTYINN